MNWYQLLFLFKGRLNRKGFWQGIGIAFALLFILASLFPMQQLLSQKHTALFPLLGLGIVFWIFVAVAIKRLHDRGRSGWAVLMAFLPILCYVVAPPTGSFMNWALARFLPIFITTLLFLDWGIFKGKCEPNKFGEKGQSLKLKDKTK